MLNLNSILIGSQNPKKLAEFYEGVFENPADMAEGDWFGWKVGSCFLSIGPHSEVEDKATEPQRILFNFETKEVKKEFDRIKELGATVIKEPYKMSAEEGDSEGEDMWIATFSDPDGNYFQLMSPWKMEK